LLEIGFWLLQTFLLFYVLYRVNAGELGIYVFLACLLGFSAYKALFSSVYQRILERCIKIYVSIYKGCKKVVIVMIITPVKAILQFVFSLLLLMIRILLSVFNFVLWLMKPLQMLMRFCYHRLPETFQ